MKQGLFDVASNELRLVTLGHRREIYRHRLASVAPATGPKSRVERCKALAIPSGLRYLAAYAVALVLDGAGSAAIPLGWGSLTSLDPKVGSQPVRQRR